MWELSDGVTCAMGAEPDESGSYILGASFLRSVYSKLFAFFSVISSFPARQG